MFVQRILLTRVYVLDEKKRLSTLFGGNNSIYIDLRRKSHLIDQQLKRSFFSFKFICYQVVIIKFIDHVYVQFYIQFFFFSPSLNTFVAMQRVQTFYFALFLTHSRSALRGIYDNFVLNVYIYCVAGRINRTILGYLVTWRPDIKLMILNKMYCEWKK